MSYYLEAHTSGNCDNPTSKDIQFAILEEESADLAGHIFTIHNDAGEALISVSGDYFKDYSLEYYDTDGNVFEAAELVNAKTVSQCFIAFLYKDYSWLKEMVEKQLPLKRSIRKIY